MYRNEYEKKTILLRVICLPLKSTFLLLSDTSSKQRCNKHNLYDKAIRKDKPNLKQYGRTNWKKQNLSDGSFLY